MQPQENSHQLHHVEQRFPSNAQLKSAERCPTLLETHHDKVYHDDTVLNDSVYCLLLRLVVCGPATRASRACQACRANEELSGHLVKPQPARLKRPRFEQISREPKSVARFTSTITTYIEQVSDHESVMLHARLPVHLARTTTKVETVRTPDSSCAV